MPRCTLNFDPSGLTVRVRDSNESRGFVPLLAHKHYIEHLSNSSYSFIEENYIAIIIVIELSPSPNSNTCESFTRSGLKLESVHQESPRSDVFRKRATKPLLNQRQRQKRLTWAVEKKNWTVAQWSKVLFSDESKFCISFGNQGPRVWRKSGEAQNPCCLKSSVKFPQSVMIWAAMSSAGVGPLCFLKSTVNTAIYQEILEHFMLPSADKLYGDADFIFQQDLAPAHTGTKGTKSWFNDHGVTVLDWPANSPDLNPIENLWGIVKRKMRDTRLGMGIVKVLTVLLLLPIPLIDPVL